MLSTSSISLPTPLQRCFSLKESWKVKNGFGMVVSLEKDCVETYKQINTFVTQGQLDEKKLDLFNNFLNNL